MWVCAPELEKDEPRREMARRMALRIDSSSRISMSRSSSQLVAVISYTTREQYQPATTSLRPILFLYLARRSCHIFDTNEAFLHILLFTVAVGPPG